MPPIISLINPPRIRQVTKRPSNTAEPHLGLAYIASCLRESGFAVYYIDGDVEGLSAEETAERALAENPLYIGLTAPTALVKSAAHVATLIKQRSSHTPVVLGGYHATVMPEESLVEFSAIDYVVFGEGEQTAVELAQALAGTGQLDQVAGICRRTANGPQSNKVRRQPLDLNALPFPAWDLFPLTKFQAHYTTDRKIIELPINTGRGCQGRCSFCARVSGNVVRRRSAESILREIEVNVEKYGARAIVFMDESFSHDRELVKVICRELIDRGLSRQMYWLCQTRVDSVDRETLELMAQSGCRHLSFGVESGDEQILTKVNKGINSEMIRQAVREAQAAGIMVDNFFILGLPGEDKKSIKRTIQFAIELNSDFANFFILVPYPGTKVYEMAKRREGGLRLLTENWDYYGIQMGKALELENVPRAALERLQLWAYMRFYLRPSRLKNMLRMVNFKILPIYLWNLFIGTFHRSVMKETTHESA